PESGNNIPDLLDEVKYELDWLLKMQNLNGGVYFKLTKQQFESFIMPNNDSGLRYIYQLSSTATGDFVAVMAKAARIFQPFDSVFANQCLNAAVLGWTFLTTNPTIVPPGGFVNPAGTVTGQYGDNNDSDERLWAAAELFETTGEVGYHNYFISNYNQSGLINSTQYWGNVKNFALLTYLNSQKSTSSETLKNSIRNSLINYCNTLRSRVTANGFGVVINPGEYSWGSNSDILNKALLLINAFEETSNNNYYEAAIFQLNYILGCNAHNLSFVTGIGTKSVRNPHHRPSASDGITDPVPGLLAGGPDQYLDDPLLQSLFNSSTPPALCYVDNVNSYASNEIAINWNAPLVFVLGYFNGEGISGIDNNTPKDFLLEQNFPNPFNPVTIIRYNLPNEAIVKIKVYDTLGSEVALLVNEKKDAGQHEIIFNANAFNLSSGVYFYKIETANYSTSKKMIYLR
ncbi:MAG: T9SS C-terminal target domain-containing protein, partial [Ignavibacteriales bacterium]